MITAWILETNTLYLVKKSTGDNYPHDGWSEDGRFSAPQR